MSPAALKRALDPAYIGSPFGLQVPFLQGTVAQPEPLDLTGREVLLFLDKKGLPDKHIEITASNAGEGVALFSGETDDWPRGEYVVEIRLDGETVAVGMLPVAKGAASQGSDTAGSAQPPTTQGLLVAGTSVVQVVLPPQGLRGPAGADGEDGHTPTDEELDALIAPQVAAAVAPYQAALDDLAARVAALEEGDAAYDLLVYGATASGVQAAVAAARRGLSVALISPNGRIGGMMTGGLSRTDYKGYNPAVWLTNQARETYTAIATHYGKTLGELGFSGTAQLAHEPKVGLSVLMGMLVDAGVTVVSGQRVIAVEKVGTEVRSIVLQDTANLDRSRVYRAPRWIDASYECDLIMRVQGLSWTFGRESNATYGETYNGVRAPASLAVSPYVVAGDAGSGLLPLFTADAPAAEGTADDKLQAFGYRLTVTTDVSNQRPWPEPAVYDPLLYEGLGRRMVATPASYQTLNQMFLVVAIPSFDTKFDVNNRGSFSLDMVGGNAGFVTLDYEAREAIVTDHYNYTLGLLKWLREDPRVPATLVADMTLYGFCADEYVDENDTGMSPELYVREAVRLVGDYVCDEDVFFKVETPEYPISYASYPMDVHGCQYHDIGGVAHVEGSFPTAINPNGLIGLDYRVLLPKRAECTNLMASCNGISVSHPVFSSLRMEPIFQSLGEAAGLAAALSLQDDVPLHDLTNEVLLPHLRPEKMIPANVLNLSGAAGIATPTNGDVSVNNPADWTFGLTTIPDFLGVGYAEGSSGAYGTKWAQFNPDFGGEGYYRMRLNLPLATNSKIWVRVDVKDATGLSSTFVRFRQGLTWFLDLGVFYFLNDGTEYVRVTNANKPGAGADGGRLQVDAVSWEPVASTGGDFLLADGASKLRLANGVDQLKLIGEFNG